MLFQKLFSRTSPQPVPVFEANACPNCWGISQWNDEDQPRHFDLDKGQSTEVNSRNGFIRRFVKRYLRR